MVFVLLNGLEDQPLIFSEYVHILDPLLQPLTRLQEERLLALYEFLLSQLGLAVAANGVEEHAILPVGQCGDFGHTHYLS